jgi:predicted TIM-barrel fold metal-dependent hydrolase
MIIDGHAYLFESPDSSRGYMSGAEHMKWHQVAYAHHHQPCFRVDDRSCPGDATVLAPDQATPLDQLPDKNFRFDKTAGRFLWEHDGETYTKYCWPPGLRDGAFTPADLISAMDYCDVDVALIHTDPSLVRDSGFLAECVTDYPERLRCMAPVEEWRLIDDCSAVITELETAIADHGLHAIKFTPTYWRSDEPWNESTYTPFWEAATQLDVPVFFTLGCGPGASDTGATREQLQRGYLDEHRILSRWMERYPNIICGLTHGFPWRLFLEQDRIVLPDEIWEPFQNPNCNLELCFPIRIGDLFDFPYREVWPTLAEMVERIGAKQLFWGTDMPFQNRFCTYRQSRLWIEKYCDFLSDDERKNIMGGTMQRVLGL